MSRSVPPPAPFLELLAAAGPPPAGPNADLYDALLGDWDAEVVDHLPDGSARRQSAEMHFARVLAGRAIQDLWIVPAVREQEAPSSAAAEGLRYGTTLRVYDAKLGAWRITWWNPVSGVEARLVGRRVGSRIVQTGADPDGALVRWCFEEVGPVSFHWVGERSLDGGETWRRETEFFARRRRAGA